MKKLNIKTICALNNITYEEFGKMIGKSRERVAMIAIGKAPLYAKDFVKIHEVFDIDYDDIAIEQKA